MVYFSSMLITPENNKKKKLARSKKFSKIWVLLFYYLCKVLSRELLKSLKIRIKNSLEKELKNASLEQNKITIIRIQKLLHEKSTQEPTS